MKQCTLCKENKALEEFYKSTQKGYQPYCKPCAKAKRAQWGRDNPAKIRQYHFKDRYGLTVKDIEAKVIEQDGLCPICESALRTNAVVDHDHKTGMPRGILCPVCNRRLGFYENEAMMIASLKYLKRWQ